MREIAILAPVRRVRLAPSTRLIRLFPVPMILLAALSASGCGETVVNSEKMEAAVKANVERSLHQKVASVACPSDQKVEPGVTFTCTIEFSDGEHATSTWKIRNKEADVDIVGFEKTK